MVHESYERIGFQFHQIVVAAAAAVVTDVAGPVVDAEYDVAADVAVAVAAGGGDEKDLQGP